MFKTETCDSQLSWKFPCFHRGHITPYDDISSNHNLTLSQQSAGGDSDTALSTLSYGTASSPNKLAVHSLLSLFKASIYDTCEPRIDFIFIL